jgi:hypothetical protein
MGHHDIKPPTTVSVVTVDDSDHESSKPTSPSDPNHDAEIAENTYWAVPMGEIGYRREARLCQPVMLAAYRPRGPPISNRCQGGNTDEFPISLALPEETEK